MGGLPPPRVPQIWSNQLTQKYLPTLSVSNFLLSSLKNFVWRAILGVICVYFVYILFILVYFVSLFCIICAIFLCLSRSWMRTPLLYFKKYFRPHDNVFLNNYNEIASHAVSTSCQRQPFLKSFLYLDGHF